MLTSQHPLWNAGFRPFFILAALAGLLLPLGWLGILHGLWPAPLANPVLPEFSAVQWHAHEMFFGFGCAVLIGFLLTASKNWVSIPGYHGGSLIALSLAWCIERASMTLGTNWPPLFFWLGNLGFIVLGVSMLAYTLLKYRARDSYRSDNIFFLIALPLLLPAKLLLLFPESFEQGVILSQSVFRLAFLLMLERTIGTFMKNALQLEIKRQPMVDRSIKVLALLLCLAAWLPKTWVSGIEILTAALLLWRLSGWHLFKAMSRVDIGIMYLGYLALTAQLMLGALEHMTGWQSVGALSLHIFTLGCIGCIAPAMFIRIANGHTGRRVVFGHFEKTILWLMILALASRTLMPQIFPVLYMRWLDITASAWAIAFGLWLWRFGIQLLAPRVDGKPG